MRSIVLWMFMLGACLHEAKATLRTVFIDDLCADENSVVINLLYEPAGILISSPPRTLESFDCTVTLLPQYRHSVVVSIYSFYVGEGNQLTIEDSDRHKIALLGTGTFEDEKKSIISEGRVFIHYQRKVSEPRLEGPSTNGTMQSYTSPGFQFTFTQVRNAPCRDKEFTCKNGNCIPEKYVCNGHNHCGDNSNQNDCVIKKDYPSMIPPTSNNSGAIIWISTIVVCGTVLVVLIIVFIVVLLRRSKDKKLEVPSSNGSNPNGGVNTIPLQSVSSTVPANQPLPPTNVNQATSAEASNGQPPSASLYDRVRRSFRRPTGTRVNEPVQQHSAESYQVPSMYPSLDHMPSAPEMHGVDNLEFKIEE